MLVCLNPLSNHLHRCIYLLEEKQKGWYDIGVRLYRAVSRTV
jgi:hypothetical protein